MQSLRLPLAPEGFRGRWFNTFLTVDPITEEAKLRALSEGTRSKPDTWGFCDRLDKEESSLSPADGESLAPVQKVSDYVPSPRSTTTPSSVIDVESHTDATLVSDAFGRFHRTAAVPQPQQVGTVSHFSNIWQVAKHRLMGKDTQLVQRLAVVDGGSEEAFSVVLNAPPGVGRGRSCFRASNGRASILINAQTHQRSTLQLTLIVGTRAFRAVHDFAAQHQWRVADDVNLLNLAAQGTDAVPIQLVIHRS